MWGGGGVFTLPVLSCDRLSLVAFTIQVSFIRASAHMRTVTSLFIQKGQSCYASNPEPKRATVRTHHAYLYQYSFYCCGLPGLEKKVCSRNKDIKLSLKCYINDHNCWVTKVYQYPSTTKQHTITSTPKVHIDVPHNTFNTHRYAIHPTSIQPPGFCLRDPIFERTDIFPVTVTTLGSIQLPGSLSNRKLL